MAKNPSGPVFMSYSRLDNDVMRRTVTFLRKKGIDVWVDNEKLIPGTPIWEAEIEKAIKAASAVIVVMSPESKDSEWVRREITLADQYGKRIFPILVRGDDDSSITLRLVTRQFVDLRKNETTGLTSLHDALAEYLSEIHAQLEEKSGSLIDQKAATTTNARNDISGSEDVKPLAPPIASQILLWFTFGWAIAGFIAGFVYSSDIPVPIEGKTGEIIGGIFGGAFGGGIGGFITSIALRSKNIPGDQKNTIRTTLAWAIGGVIGWSIGWGLLTEASGAGIGMAIFPLIGMAGTLGVDYVVSNWKSTAWITLAWAIGSAIGWTISKPFLIETLDFDQATSWGIGTAIGWAIGGFVMGWQLKKEKG